MEENIIQKWYREKSEKLIQEFEEINGLKTFKKRKNKQKRSYFTDVKQK